MEEMNIYGYIIGLHSCMGCLKRLMPPCTDVPNFTRLSTLAQSLGGSAKWLVPYSDVPLADYNKEPWKTYCFTGNKEAITT